MADENRLIRTNTLMEWLKIMAENLKSNDDEYCKGTADAYRNITHALEIGLFDEKSTKDESSQGATLINNKRKVFEVWCDKNSDGSKYRS